MKVQLVQLLHAESKIAPPQYHAVQVAETHVKQYAPSLGDRYLGGSVNVLEELAVRVHEDAAYHPDTSRLTVVSSQLAHVLVLPKCE